MHERFVAARSATLASVTATGAAHAVPICFALLDDSIVTVIDGKPKSTQALRRLDNIRANPQVSVLADRYDDDWTALWWVRVDGEARVVEDDGLRRRAIEALAAKYPQYQKDRPRGPVIVIAPTTWRSWAWDTSR